MMYRALDHWFSLDEIASDVAADVRRVLHPLETGDAAPPPGAEVHALRVQRLPTGHVQLLADGEPSIATKHPGVATSLLVSHVTAAAVQSRSDDLVLHAGCVLIDDTTLVISGRSGTGKSTLTMALVAAGATYLTDEAVVVDREGHVVDALGRSPQLDRRSRRLLRHDGWASVEHPDSSSYIEIPETLRWNPHPGSAVPESTALVLLGTPSAPRTADVIARTITDSFDPRRLTQDGLDRTAAFVGSSVALPIARDTPQQMVDAVRRTLASNSS